ncbi:helix-turn-helix domain-containing protein [Micromonospora sp. NPDC049275]|uniref:helix-turn-helix domain-containing protein n=1 Tax=Micromonospora sp. NPDC049275 TaxID=3364268 RepID=UPI003710545C
MTTGDLRPDEAADPVAFVDLLRQLKDASRLTYRQLEQRAAAAGDVLARSTAADVLRRSTLPRPEVLAAFVRACGAGDQVDAWLRARDRLADGAYAPTSPAPSRPPTEVAGSASADVLAGGRPDEAGPRWFARPAPLALLAVAAVLAALGAWFLRPDDDDRRPTAPQASAGTSSSATTGVSVGPSSGPKGGPAEIRPARSPQLCLTEGHDRTGEYPSEVAVQRRCTEATPPETYLQPVTAGLYFIKWNHPVQGPGCLTIREADPARNLLEPWKECQKDREIQLFRFEPTGSAPTAYRIRPARGDLCVGLRDDDGAASADAPIEALVEPCTGGADQEFLIADPAAG